MPADEVVYSPRGGHVLSTGIEPPSYFEPLALDRIFGRPGALHVDLGCGEGRFLCAQARRFPGKNFLGIERLLGRASSAAHKAAPIENVRVLRIENSYAVRYLLPPGSVETFYLLFPDPWPKRRHQRRRLVNADFLSAIHTALADRGLFHIATDQKDYFSQIDEITAADSAFENIAWNDVNLPVTRFEARFRRQGAPIYRLTLRKISPVT